MKISILQCDNRNPNDVEYIKLSISVNKKVCDILGYSYHWKTIIIDNNNVHPACYKIKIVNEFLKTSQDDILIFLDTDAWIHNTNKLQLLIHRLIDSSQHGIFSRDPYFIDNTFINSGTFILNINDFTRKMYSTISKTFHNYMQLNNSCSHPFDQLFISDFVFQNKNEFIILIPEAINTPIGMIIRHNWWKQKRMYKEMNMILTHGFDFISDPFDIDQILDKNIYPNIIPISEWKIIKNKYK